MYKNLLEIPYKSAQNYGDRLSHQYREGKNIMGHSFSDFKRDLEILAAGFSSYGINEGDHIGFFVNNRYDWMGTDFALIALKAISVPRGSDSTPRELQFIYNHSDSSSLILENVKQLKELIPLFTAHDWAQCKVLFIVDQGDLDTLEGLSPEIKDKIIFYTQVKEKGQKIIEENPQFVTKRIDSIENDQLMTIVYTSGTTGNPKGVMLTHGNFLQNVAANTPRLAIDPEKKEKCVVMLPSWHVYERAFEYCALSAALTIFYSSASRFAQDLLEVKPEVLISVPRMWESIYQKMIRVISKMPAPKRFLIFFYIKCNQIYLTSLHRLKKGYISLKVHSPLRRFLSWSYHLCLLLLTYPGHKISHVLFKPFREKVGGRLRVATSAAGALPKYLDELFNSLGMLVVNAYGMTECAPGILSRTIERNTFGSAGIPFANTEVEIRRENGTLTDVGEKGVIYARGPQVMKGYYKNQEATDKVLDKEGWLNTGDLAVRSANGEVVIVGRLKDTIVLMGGENVEPEPIEEKMKESLYIDHAVVLGQDQKQLSAIVVLNEESLMNLAKELKLSPTEVLLEGADSIEHDKIYRVIMKEVHQLISREQGFKPFEAITKVLPVINDFTIGKELTQTLKIKRKFIEDRYKRLIGTLLHDSKKKHHK